MEWHRVQVEAEIMVLADFYALRCVYIETCERIAVIHTSRVRKMVIPEKHDSLIIAGFIRSILASLYSRFPFFVLRF